MGNTSGMEENKMQNITIGKSGIEVPFLGMGTWAIGGGSWWGDNDDALSVNAIEAAVEQGIRWIDTAPIYGLYHSEQVVGEALRHIDRDKVVLSTKCGLEWRHETPVLHKVVDGTSHAYRPRGSTKMVLPCCSTQQPSRRRIESAVETSSICGQLCNTHGLWQSTAAAKMGKTLFFAP